MTQPRPIDRNAPTRPGGDYDVSLNYRVEDEHQYGESSAAGMIRGAIAEADARDQQIANDSLNLIFQHYTDEEYDDVEYFEDDFQAILIQLIEEDGRKLIANIEKQKQLSISNSNFDPDGYIQGLI